MSRYRGPKLRIVRRLGVLPGLTSKTSKKLSRPGKDSNLTDSNKLTEYGIRLEEKQKLKFNYGLTESQLFKYVKEARRQKGVTGLILLQLLEMRLDSLCFTLGFAKSINQARQMVNHGHITINNKVVSIPNFQCQIDDVIGIKENLKSKKLLDLIKYNLTNSDKLNTMTSNSMFKFNQSKLEATIVDYCSRDTVQLQLDELLVIEYYSRR